MTRDPLAVADELRDRAIARGEWFVHQLDQGESAWRDWLFKFGGDDRGESALVAITTLALLKESFEFIRADGGIDAEAFGTVTAHLNSQMAYLAGLVPSGEEDGIIPQP